MTKPERYRMLPGSIIPIEEQEALRLARGHPNAVIANFLITLLLAALTTGFVSFAWLGSLP